MDLRCFLPILGLDLPSHLGTAVWGFSVQGEDRYQKKILYPFSVVAWDAFNISPRGLAGVHMAQVITMCSMENVRGRKSIWYSTYMKILSFYSS